MELKFRAYYHGAGDPRITASMVYSNAMSLATFFEEVEHFPLGLEVMQFTGLQDKNGVDIWEGDIVKHDKGNAEVKQNHGCWTFERKVDFWINAHWHMKEAEIIGNIYQNPELMEK